MKLTGKQLIEWGFEECSDIGKILNHFIESEFVTYDRVKKYHDSIKIKKVSPRDTPAEYSIYLDCENDLERENLEKCKSSMDIIMRCPTMVSGALMPDACPSGEKGTIPVGAVVTVKNAIHPDFHSSDICCSLMATNLGKDFNVSSEKMLEYAMKTTHFGFGKNPHYDLAYYNLMENFLLKNPILNKNQKSIFCASNDSGTQGDGNHFFFYGKSKRTGSYYIVTHHGSRGLGNSLYKDGKRLAEQHCERYTKGLDKRSYYIPFDSKDGQEYWDALDCVRTWTVNNHYKIHETLLQVIDYKVGTESGILKYPSTLFNSHNFVYKEGDLFHHAKGITPMRMFEGCLDECDSRKLVPMNSRDGIILLERDNSDFAPHGAGRNLSRTSFLRESSEEVLSADIGKYITPYSGEHDLSEHPDAYKGVEKIRKDIAKYRLGNIVDIIEPIFTIMAGKINYRRN